MVDILAPISVGEKPIADKWLASSTLTAPSAKPRRPRVVRSRRASMLMLRSGRDKVAATVASTQFGVRADMLLEFTALPVPLMMWLMPLPLAPPKRSVTMCWNITPGAVGVSTALADTTALSKTQ